MPGLQALDAASAYTSANVRMPATDTSTALRTTMKAMFLPLKSQYFDAFKAGTKTVEYRRYCKRWDERTCAIGRAVVLSRGYGKHSRLSGIITAFERRFMSSAEWVDCYGESGMAACISISLIPAVQP